MIEAKDKTEIEYNELAEEFASEILRELKSLIGDDFTLWTEDSRSMLKESIEKKVLNNTAKINNKLKYIKKDIFSAETIEEIIKTSDIYLTKEEFDYLIFNAYEDSKNIKELNCSVIFQFMQNKEKLLTNEDRQINEYEALNEEQIVCIAQKCFYEIAQKMISKECTSM